MIDFSSAPGNLMNILGKLAGLYKESSAYEQTLLDELTDTDGIVDQLAAMPDIQAIAGGQYIQLANNPGQNVLGFAQSLAAQVINRIVFLDQAQLGQTLTQQNTLASIAYVIQQMVAQGQTVQKQTVSATPTTFQGVGNAVVITSVIRPFDGRMLENMYAELLTVTCVSDSYNGGATAGQESVAVTGQGNQVNFLAFDWPLGSNATGGLTLVDPNSDATGGNLLTNSSFEDFTDNVPDNFELTVGTAGVNVFEEGGIVYEPVAGGKSIRLLGDGATLIQFRQAFDDAEGTISDLSVQTQYSVCCFLRRDGIAPAAGVLQVDLFNTTTGLVVIDVANTPCSFTIDLTSLTTNFLSFTGCFRTPAILSGEVCFRFHLTTPLTTGRSVYLDTFSMGTMGQLYVGGPYVNVHAGSIPLFNGDFAHITTTNNRGGAATVYSWQTSLWMLYPEVAANEILFPSALANPSISDGLIS